MKKVIFPFAMAALLITGCKKEKVDDLYVIDFEDPRVEDYLARPTSYGENLYSSFGAGQYVGYEDAGSGLYMMINEANLWGMGMSVEFWNGGIAISRWNDMTTGDYTNQCSVYYKDDKTGYGGYKGSKTFAIATGYINDSPFGTGDTRSSISFNDNATERTFDHFWVNNSTYTVLSMMKGGDFGSKIFSYADADWFKLVITAYDKTGSSTGATVEFYLADFRTRSSPGIITEWTKVDLTPLGNKVHTVKFDLKSSDNSIDEGMNTPGYFCFDHLAIKK